MWPPPIDPVIRIIVDDQLPDTAWCWLRHNEVHVGRTAYVALRFDVFMAKVERSLGIGGRRGSHAADGS